MTKLEEILNKYTRYEEHYEYHYDCDPSDGHVDFDSEKAKQAILAWVEQDIIGEDEPNSSEELDWLPSKDYRNDLRAEQRKKLLG